MGAGGVAIGSDAVSVHSARHGPFQDMVDTYGQHGVDNLSLWLTNAKEAAAKITEVTRARQREKDDKYVKFMRDLQTRVAASTKEKNLSKIARARPRRKSYFHTENDGIVERVKCDGPEVHDMGGRDLGPRPVSKMDKVRVFLEKQLSKNSNDDHRMSKLHRECMLHALTGGRKVTEPLEEKICNTHHNPRTDRSSVVKKSDGPLPNLLSTLCLAPPSPKSSGQIPDAVTSQLCTPMGWDMIPASFGALDVRSLETIASPPSPQTRESELKVKSSRVLCPKENLKHFHVERHKRRIPTRSQSSLGRFQRGGQHEIRGKENVRSSTSIGICILNNDDTQNGASETCSNTCRGENTENQHEASVSSSSPNNEGETTCPPGVVGLKGRDEYELQGKGKQFFSDVWKCAMEVERRCAHERAYSLHILKKKRLEQQKAEKRHKAELMREKSMAKQREAVQKQLKTVATLKARREAIVQRHRALEKKRFAHALQEVRMENTEGYAALQVDPLCNCGHGVHPLNVHYIKKCYVNCPLRNNFPEYALRLENKLLHLLDEYNASYYPIHDLHWLPIH